MASRLLAGPLLIGFLLLTGCSSGDDANGNASSAPTDAMPSGTVGSSAPAVDSEVGRSSVRRAGPSGRAADFVVVSGHPLVYTGQVLPIDAEGKLVGESSDEKQVEQVLENLQTLLAESGSGLERLAKLNIYADSAETINKFQEQLWDRLDAAVRPAVCAVISPLSTAHAVVAVDAVAIADDQGENVTLQQCTGVATEVDCADVAVKPRGGVVYLSGQADKSPLPQATVKSMTTLLDVVKQLGLQSSQIVQLKVFVDSAAESHTVRAELKRLFPDQMLPPVIFVEWIASAPVEIEIVVHLPRDDWRDGKALRFFTPADVKPSPVFSRAALIQSDRQIFISGLTSREPGGGEVQVRDVFTQLQEILTESGSDWNHLAKATYYVSDEEASDMLNKLRPEYYNPERPPAASKAMVHGVGRADRTILMDMIAVGGKNEAQTNSIAPSLPGNPEHSP
jgi:enamine deaminase RidA (YjgF/YER057c/UK114 family)